MDRDRRSDVLGRCADCDRPVLSGELEAEVVYGGEDLLAPVLVQCPSCADAAFAAGPPGWEPCQWAALVAALGEALLGEEEVVMRMRDEHARAQNVDRGAPSAGLSRKGRDLSAGDPWSYPRAGPYQHPALPEAGIRLLPSLLLHTFARDGREGLRGWGVDLEGSLGAGLGPFVLGEADPESEEAILGGGTGTLVLKSGEVLTASGHRFFALLALDRASGYALEDALLVLPGRDADYPAGRPAGFASTSDPLLPEPLPRLLSDDARFRDLSIHPFAYAYYDVALWEQDPHVDPETGWSYDGGEKVMEALARNLSRRSEAR